MKGIATGNLRSSCESPSLVNVTAKPRLPWKDPARVLRLTKGEAKSASRIAATCCNEIASL
jgi:hypothetical protein